MYGKKKILMLGNSELVVLGFRKELVEALLAEGHQVYACFPQTEFGNGCDAAKEVGCTYIPVDISSHGTDPMTDLKLFLAFRRIIREIKPDMLLSYTIKPNIYGGMAAASCGVPYVMNVSGLGTAVERPGPLQLVTLFLYRLAVWRARQVFFQNQENEGFFASRHIADGRRSLLPGSGVNLQRFQLLPYPNEGQVHFLFMGRIMKEKGIEQYLDAAEVIHRAYPGTLFHILGVCTEKQYRDRISELEQAGAVRYHGYRKELIPFQAMSSCTVHPTCYPEGLSNVLLETAASGRPMIATDRSGCREVIQDGVNGFVIKQRDSEDLVKTLEKFLSLSWEQRRDMGLAGRAKVEREFDRQIVVGKYLKEISEAFEPVCPK